ncbi:MAG: hypothetical protein ACREGF_00235 [Candidatus Saccharimonadales bacterium]
MFGRDDNDKKNQDGSEPADGSLGIPLQPAPGDPALDDNSGQSADSSDDWIGMSPNPIGDGQAGDPVATPVPTAVDDSNAAAAEPAADSLDMPDDDSTPSALDNPSFSLPDLTPGAPDIKLDAGRGYLTAPSTPTEQTELPAEPATSSASIPMPPISPMLASPPVMPPPAITTTSFAMPAAPLVDDLLSLKQQALQELTPLLAQLDQTPEEKFRTTMMMIQAADNQSLIPTAYQAAHQITDEKVRGQALLDVVNEINYFTQKQNDTSASAT